MHKYYKPDQVLSPKKCVRSVTPLYDGGISGNYPYSLAIVNWNGENCIGIRWNLTNSEWDTPNKRNGSEICVGEPNSRGYPTWFILPMDFLSQIVNQNSDIVAIIKKAFEEINQQGDDE